MSDTTSLIQTDIQSAQIQEVLPKLQDLQDALLRQDPDIANRLKVIRTNLALFPELVHLLNDEQIAPIYQAMILVSGTEIAAKASKKKVGGKASSADAELLRSLM